MKLSTIFGGFWGLNDSSYLSFEDALNSQFFLSFMFCFGHKTPEGMNKLYLKISDTFFL